MWIKICGLQDAATAVEIANLGVNAIGLNFYPKSRRYVSIGRAVEITSELPDHVVPVGLFVNATIDVIRDTCSQCGIQFVQLHGDESPEFLQDLQKLAPHLQLIRARRLAADAMEDLIEDWRHCSRLGVHLAAYLVDAYVSGTYGGTGAKAPWETLTRQYDQSTLPPLILAGGLEPANVASAIRQVRPWGVDVASGVESPPGQKNLTISREFVNSAVQAFQKIDADDSDGEASDSRDV